MILENEDFVQFYVGKKKVYGFINRDKVLNSEGEEVIEVREASSKDLRFISEEDLIANFGKSPDFEDLKTEVLTKEFVVPLFGSVTCYRDLTDLEEKYIKDAMSDIEKDVKDFPIYPTRIFIKHNKGKKVGCCKFNKKEEVFEITLCPKAFDKENLKSILLHEIAHAVWDSTVDMAYKAKWIRLYDRNMERKSVASQEIVQLRLDLLESGMSVNDYIKNMEDGDAMKKVADRIKELYNLKPQHLDILISQGDDLSKYWPDEAMQISETSAFVSQYATESVEEFFAETFMFKYMSMELPAAAEKAINATLKVMGII